MKNQDQWQGIRGQSTGWNKNLSGAVQTAVVEGQGGGLGLAKTKKSN
jgi:hypothetical protein